MTLEQVHYSGKMQVKKRGKSNHSPTKMSMNFSLDWVSLHGGWEHELLKAPWHAKQRPKSGSTVLHWEFRWTGWTAFPRWPSR